MSLSKWIDDDRCILVTITGITGCVLVGRSIRIGIYSDDSLVYPGLIVGSLSIILAVALNRRQEWSRWGGILLVACCATLLVRHTFLHGITISRAIARGSTPFVLRRFWDLKIADK
jgi:hypothetical protein